MSYNRNRCFSREAYERCDDPAKSITIKYLNQQGVYTLSKKENGKVDIIGLTIDEPNDDDTIYYESEIKDHWFGEFPFDTVDIPYRKRKLLKNYDAEKLTFFIISADFKSAISVPGEAVAEALAGPKTGVVSKWTQNRGKEKFIRVPLHKCKLHSLKGVIKRNGRTKRKK